MFFNVFGLFLVEIRIWKAAGCRPMCACVLSPPSGTCRGCQCPCAFVGLVRTDAVVSILLQAAVTTAVLYASLWL